MPYPSYKQTGVDWLSSVPTHWSLEPLGKHFAARSSTVSDSDYQPLSVTRDGIVPQLENVAKTDNGDNRSGKSRRFCNQQSIRSERVLRDCGS